MNKERPHKTEEESAERMSHLARKFLVHSFLYYRLSEQLILDKAFDALSQELYNLSKAFPNLDFAYREVVLPHLGEEHSAYALMDYPIEMQSMAFKLLYAEEKSNLPFEEFVQKWDYQVKEAKN